jgi:DNA polymerase alpha subunit A
MEGNDYDGNNDQDYGGDDNGNMDEIIQKNDEDDLTTLETAAIPPSESEIKSEGDIRHKISLSKTTRKLKVNPEPIKYEAPSNPNDEFKPVLPGHRDDSAGLELESIMSLGSGPMSAEGANSDKAINPSLWLQKREIKSEEVGVESSKEEEYMSMYWLDACEQNGVIYLFGKVALAAEGGKDKRFVSCCVAVHGSERNLFVLPRATGTTHVDGTPVRYGMAEVHKELSSLLVPDIIPRSQGQSFKCKTVKRKYAFEHGEIPRRETEYLKVVYTARHGYPSVKQCLGGKHIERIFGAGSSCLELFLLKRKLMGPCWITIKNPRTIAESISWCSVEVGVEDPKSVVKIPGNEAPPTPPLISMCVSMKTALNTVTHLHEIVVLSALVHTKVDAEADTELTPSLMRRFTLVRQLGLTCGNSYPAVFPHDLANEIKKVITVNSRLP